VPFTWAKVRGGTNQVTLVSASGAVRPATIAACLCPGESINTSNRARAEVVFNDGSLARVGEQTSLNFWPNTRRLRLTEGTAAVFVPPNQGRTTFETPNAKVGLNSTGVVVRYVPTRGLTLVMALANSPAGPVSITAGKIEQETALYAGQMAFVSGGTLQIVEFDLQEFYQTSDLMAGLQIDNPTYSPAADEPLAALRPDLLTAISQQANFEGDGAILDPTLISDFATEPDLQTPAGDVGSPLYPTEELRRYNETPAGVVSPLPEDTLPPAVEAPSSEAPPVEPPPFEPPPGEPRPGEPPPGEPRPGEPPLGGSPSVEPPPVESPPVP
jgi:hypothetical protein